MKEIKRYRFMKNGTIREDDEGKHVKYTDHKAVVEEMQNDFQYEMGKIAEKENKDSILVHNMQNKIDELEKENKELKENILDIVDQCFHAYASSSRGEAVEYAQELMDESE